MTPSSYEAEPVYQSGYQTTGNRAVSDVAIDGDPNTGPGYDFVTGLGSPQANLLIPALVKTP